MYIQQNNAKDSQFTNNIAEERALTMQPLQSTTTTTKNPLYKSI